MMILFTDTQAKVMLSKDLEQKNFKAKLFSPIKDTEDLDKLLGSVTWIL